MSANDFGILACGAYVPQLRLPTTLVGAAHGWFAPSLKTSADTRRSFCNWDEDAITMAVEASRDCLSHVNAELIRNVRLASTTLPFADRSNVGLMREALDLRDDANIADIGGSMRAASSALIRILAQRNEAATLLAASDCVDTRPASVQEASYGHGAAAVVVGVGEPIATVIAAQSLHQDFVDHYRASAERFEYALEARWTRDAGYRQQTRDTLTAALAQAGIEKDDVDHIAIAAPPALARAIARSTGATNVAGAELQRHVGFCAAAQPLLLLVAALQSAKPGETVVLLSVGQGIDVLVLQVERAAAGDSLHAMADGGVAETNYCRYLSLRRLLELEEGIRAERDNRSAQAAAWRKHVAITGFIGGQCSECSTLQFPPSKLCVSCGAEDTQQRRRLADMQGRVRSFTEDWLAFTPKPPLMFGNVGFENGANVMMEFTDFETGQLAVGMPVRMRFRIKDFDDRRGFRRYFWKPAPTGELTNG